MMFSSDNLKVYALSKDNYISVSIDMQTLETKSSKKSVTSPVDIQTIEEPKEVDIGNLFSDVWTKKISKKKQVKKKDNKRLQEILKKTKTLQKSSTSELTKKIDSSSSAISNKKNSQMSSGTEVNEYLAKIQALVYKYFNPPQNSQGHSVKVVIKLSAIGKVLDFRILSYSNSQALNEESDRVKNRLTNVLFPINPQNKSGNYVVILKSKE